MRQVFRNNRNQTTIRKERDVLRKFKSTPQRIELKNLEKEKS